jgi:predicted GIY-YIG superfamily endonuclease
METYNCKCCLYNTNNISYFKRHKKTKKHLKQIELSNKDDDADDIDDDNDDYSKNKKDADDEHNFYVYLLIASDNSTYVGATIDLQRRLRQHNKEIKGGAMATSIKVNKGHIWTRVCFVKNFPSWASALQLEWKWKHESRKLFKTHKLPIKRRMYALKNIIFSERSTSKAIPFSEWNNPPEIIFENCFAENLYNSIL